MGGAGAKRALGSEDVMQGYFRSRLLCVKQGAGRYHWTLFRRVAWLMAPLLSVVACAGADKSAGSEAQNWQLVHQDLPGALLSVWGSSEADVWSVGGDSGDGLGPTVLHYDGAGWKRLVTGTSGDLLWVFGFRGGPVYLGGDGGVILRYEAGAFARMQTPSSGVSVFGIWGSSENDVWAVGGASGGASGAFAWKLNGDAWEPASSFPADLADKGAMWKMFGRSPNDAWLVGTNGQAVRRSGESLAEASTGVSESLFTVHANGDRFAAVGGFGTGLILENDGSGWHDRSPNGAAPLIGVFLTAESGYAVGQFGSVYARAGDAWNSVDTGLALESSLHSVWCDDAGGVWAVGGDVLTKPLVRGVMVHRGKQVSGDIE
jgi:hypothetical protein